MAATHDKSQPPAEVPAATRRKPYTAPRLKAYGSVAKLTQGSASVGSDLVGMQKRTMCL